MILIFSTVRTSGGHWIMLHACTNVEAQFLTDSSTGLE